MDAPRIPALQVLIGSDTAEETFQISWNPNGLPGEDLEAIHRDLGGLLQQLRDKYGNEPMTKALTGRVHNDVTQAYQAATWEWKARVTLIILEQALYP